MKIAVLSMVVTYVSSLLDFFLVGQVMGEEALQAFTLLSPYLSIIFFVSCLISSGTSVMIAFEVGKGNREEGNGLLTQGLIIAIVVGVLMSFLLYFGKSILLGNVYIADEIKGLMNEYYKYVCLLPLSHIVGELLFSVIWNAGGDLYCAISLAIKLFVNVFASVILMEYIGIGGTGLGTILGCIAAIAVLLFYMRSENCVLKWKRYFDIKSAVKVFRYGTRDAMIYLYMALLQFIMNTYLLYKFGGSAILIFSVIMNIANLYLTVFNAPSNAVSVLLTVFVGEENRHGVLKSMKTAERTATLEGILTILLLVVFARWIPAMFGINEVPDIEAVKRAIRLYALGALVYPYIMLYSTYYLAIQRVFLSMRMMTMQVLIMPILFGILLSQYLGVNGVWIGLSLGTIITFLIDALILRFRHQDKSFPHLLNLDKLNRQLSYDVPITEEGVMLLVNQVESDLKERKIESKKIYRIMLMIEETEMLVVERNAGRGGIIQCDIFLENPIRLILRDSGPYSDVTDQNSEAESFRAYAATMIGGSFGANKYVIAWGNNRTVCKF